MVFKCDCTRIFVPVESSNIESEIHTFINWLQNILYVIYYSATLLYHHSIHKIPYVYIYIYIFYKQYFLAPLSGTFPRPSVSIFRIAYVVPVGTRLSHKKEIRKEK